MKILRGNRDLTKPMKRSRDDIRREIYTWMYLYFNFKEDLAPIECGTSLMRESIANCFSRRPYMEEEIERSIQKYMVPESELSWISEEKRLQEWLRPILQRRVNERFFFQTLHLQGRDLLIAMIDVWRFDIQDKIYQIKEIKKDWFLHKEGDCKFKWFSDEVEGDMRCKFAWGWLQKNERGFDRGREPIENYNDLLMFFDQMNFSSAEIILKLKNIRQSWNRQRSRERQTEKKQYNFILSKAAVNFLDKLTETHVLSRAQVLEILIKKESEKGVYLAGWEKRFE
ncbi:hypothetical protein GCM10027202_37390 [Microvirgula curvata]